MYKVIIKWASGEIESHITNTEEEAEKVCENYRIAFGRQVEWCGFRRLAITEY